MSFVELENIPLELGVFEAFCLRALVTLVTRHISTRGVSRVTSLPYIWSAYTLPAFVFTHE